MANYQSQEGRWMQQDPMQYVDGLNLYQYVNSCPLLQNDYLGLFSGKTHKQLSREAFNSIINTGPEQYSEKCKSEMLKKIMDANAGQDSKNFFDYPLHYNRHMGDSQKDADADYQDHIQTELSAAIPSGSGKRSCTKALETLGRLDHILQDYFMHAIGDDGSWNVWSNGYNPDPYNRSGTHPSSYEIGGYNTEHPNGTKGEPVDLNSAEGQARLAAARAFMAKHYDSFLGKWMEICSCWCKE